MNALRFNTAIARLTELNNRLTTVVTRDGSAPREVVEPLVLMTAPLAPHIAEELWELIGHPKTLTYEPFPEADPALLVEDQVEIAVQVDGKLRARVKVAAGADDAAHEAAARTDEKVAALLAEKPARKVIVVPGRLVNFIR
jgi:leucyl-tRNA synthetase